jgi:hypothetical protein
MFLERSEVGKLVGMTGCLLSMLVHSDNGHNGCAGTFAVVAHRRLGFLA